jgi:HEAT repeat protein
VTGLRRIAAAAGLAALAALAGCRSFAKLEANDPSVGELEVSAAGDAGDEDLLANLHHILDHRADYSREVVVAALASVAERGEQASVAHVTPLAEDADEEVRWHVARTLAELGGAQARATLADMARSDPSALVRSAAEE